MLVNSVLGRLRQEDQEFETSLDLFLKKIHNWRGQH
jgi:hypothetical protein